MSFLPTTRREMDERGWDQADFLAHICGDAYVDRSLFGMAIITRLLDASRLGTRGAIAQPDWRDAASIAALGEPPGWPSSCLRGTWIPCRN